MRSTRTAKVEALQRIIAQNKGKTEAQSAGKDMRRKRTPNIDASADSQTAEDEDEVCRKMA